MTSQTNEPKALTLPQRLRMKADMITMGERIEFGSECLIMHEAAEEIERLKRQVDERDRLLRWAASDFEKHGINNDNWYADYEALAAADKIEKE